jgi:microcystin-dependent protein
LGTTYGGDGQTNFALPNLNAGALQSGLNYIIASNDIYPSRP